MCPRLILGKLEQTGTLNLERVGRIDCMELSRNFQRVCVAGREFLFYSRRGNTVERWIAINRSIPKLRNTVAITNHRAEWRRGCTSKYANIIARGLCSFYAYEFSDVLPRIFHLSTVRAIRGFMMLRNRYAIPLRSRIEGISF